MSFRTYEDVLDYIARFTDYERMAPVAASARAYNLRRMGRLLDRLGHPQRRFRSVHIAGTKGKGSTAHFTEAILRGCGMRTGLYTSPHLVDMLERIQVGGRPVSRREFVRVMERMRPALERVRPTYFELMTAAAFEIFARRGVEAAVVEVGLGGRLDATNVLRPEACAITRIDYDHTTVLGRTLGAIAREKAGILKSGVPAVVAPQRPAAMRAIRRAGRAVGAPILAPPGINHARTRWSARGFVLECDVEGLRLRIPVAGAHQAGNAAMALALARLVTPVPPGTARRALAGARVPGRIELAARRPDVVVDTAHNPASARALRETLERLAPRRPRVLVFGTPADKDVRGILRELLPGTRLAVFTRSRNPRASAPAALARLSGNVPHVTIGSVPRAVDVARKAARRGELVVVAGSFVVAGEALEHLWSRSLKRSRG